MRRLYICRCSGWFVMVLTFVLGVVLIGCGPKTTTGDGGDGGDVNDGAIDGGAADVELLQDGDLVDAEAADAEVCAQSSVSATLEVKPVDIIVFIDNSGSMSAEIEEVEVQITSNFSSILDAADPPIDYRVIMLSRFGSYGGNDICVAEPLGGISDADSDGHCDTIPSEPVNTSKFFHHSASISSHNGLCRVIEQMTTSDEYNLQPTGYAEVLREDAFKFFLVVTDDGVNCGDYSDSDSVDGGWEAAYAFDTDLLTLFPEHFGESTENRNYTFWSIVSLAPYEPTVDDPYGEPHPPDTNLAPVTAQECTPSAADPGTGYQALSIMTGGYRYPTCGLEYTKIFELMAEGVILGAAVACEYLIPEPPEGETLDLDTVQIRYSSDGEEVDVFNPSPSLEECAQDEYEFYIEGDYIKLCPNSCELVQADENAQVDVLFGCELNVVID